MATKRKSSGSKHDKLIGIYAPKRFGFDSIEVVECFYCGAKQRRSVIINKQGLPHSIRQIELHHIIPVASHPELERCAENMIFLCHEHHRDFHRRYDRSIRVVNSKYDPKKRIVGGNQPYWLRHIPATLENLQEYLGLTAKETVAHQLGWPKTLRKKLGVTDGFFADQELSRKLDAQDQQPINQAL